MYECTCNGSYPWCRVCAAQDAPTERRRVTATDGEELVVLMNVDGEEYVVNAYDFDNPGIL